MIKSTNSRVFHSINFTTFYLTACDAVNKIHELNNYFEEKKDITLEDESVIRSILFNTQRLSVTTIIFCTMTLESFINYYGSMNLSKSYFEKYLDNLDLKSKWIIVPKLVTGKQINTGKKAFAYLSNLIALRNKFVHDKLKIKVNILSDDNDFLSEGDAYEAIECVKLLVKELKEIDSNTYSDWIL